MVSKWKELGLNADEGDTGFIIVDIDNDGQKVKKIVEIEFFWCTELGSSCFVLSITCYTK